MKTAPILVAALLFGFAACHRTVTTTPPEEPKPEIPVTEIQPEPAPSIPVEAEPAPAAPLQPESVTLDSLRALVSGTAASGSLDDWFNAMCVSRENHDETWNRFVLAVRADPLGSANLLRHASDFPLLGQLYNMLAAAIGGSDPGFVRKWAETAPEDMKADIAAGLLSVWAGTEPQQAAQWLARDPLLREDSNCCEALITTWAATDPAAASRWTFAQPPGTALDAAIDALGRTWGGSDPTAAAAFLQKQSVSPARDDFAAALAEGWAAHDVNAATAWYLSAPVQDESSREQPLYTLFSGLAGQDTTKAEHFVDGMAWGASRDSAIRGIIDTVVVDNPKQAVLWCTRISDAETRAAIAQSLMTELADRSPELVKQLGQLPLVGK